MASIGSSLAGVRAKRAVRLGGVQRAPAGSAKVRAAPVKEQASLTVEVAGVLKKRFVLGVHALDDADRYVG